MKIYKITGLILLSIICFSCRTNKEKKIVANQQTNSPVIKIPEFNADSAYLFVKKQVDFGPRVPNTEGHIACGNYIAGKLVDYGAEVINQYADLTRYDGTLLKSRNIIGSYNPEKKRRIALFAHWDTRPWADNDPNPSNHHSPILGANDGASGVGVLLEIARQIAQNKPEVGIDLIFLDAEDAGAPQFYKGKHKEEYWCLGSQYWSKYPHKEGYNARFGILLDMVGGKNAVFFQEGFSNEYAPSIVKKIWDKANEIGYGSYFIKEEGGYVTDDHFFINRIAKIPTVDIISTNREDGSFGSFWHTLHDNMDVIDRSTLKAVGQTVTEVIYNEK